MKATISNIELALFDEIFRILDLEYKVDENNFVVEFLGKVSKESLFRYLFMCDCYRFLKDFRRKFNKIDHREKVSVMKSFYECMKSGVVHFRVKKYKLHTESIRKEDLVENRYLSLKRIHSLANFNNDVHIDWFSTDEIRFRRPGEFRVLNVFSFEYASNANCFTDWEKYTVNSWRWLCPLK